MAGIFQVNEVVSIAVEIEKKGEAFYLKMADKAKDAKVKEALRFLAGEELKHQKTFSQLLAKMEPLKIPAGELESDYWSYVNDLVDSHFLFDSSENQRLIAGATSDLEMLRLAMGFEKESILFFTEMKGLVPAEYAQNVDACIREERTHLRKLAQMMSQKK